MVKLENITKGTYLVGVMPIAVRLRLAIPTMVTFWGETYSFFALWGHV
jgi:hypothetical protein